MPKKIIADSGYWYALFNERDQYHAAAKAIEEEIEVHAILVPWPTLYEAINTRFTRKSHQIHQLKKLLELPTTSLIEDSPYREASLQFILNSNAKSYSLVDHVIRSMISDTAISIDAFVGFNPKDFYDVCDPRGITMLYR